jgi:enoyl-[acyl-carrier-protein] reductase (NADH)
MTYKWGGADEDELRSRFTAAGFSSPNLVQADASEDADTREVLQTIRARHERLEAFVSNVAFAALVRSPEDYVQRGLATSINYSAWPLVSHTLAAREVFGRPPRYVVGISSPGSAKLGYNYDIVAASKAVLETLCRYLHYRLAGEDCRVNVVRTKFVASESLAATFGDEFIPFAQQMAPDLFSTADEVGEAVFGVCSGLMDALGGQVLDVDGGASFRDCLSHFFEQRHQFPIPQRSKP